MNERVDPLTFFVDTLQVGFPYPYPCRPGLRLDVRARGDELRATLVLGIEDLTDRELTDLGRGQIALGILHWPPTTWLTLHAGELAYDAPYVLGLEEPAHVARVLGRLAAIASGDAAMPEGVDLHCVDTRSGRLALMRHVRMPEAWSRVLHRSLAVNKAPITPELSRSAMRSDFERWPSTSDMTRAAHVIGIDAQPRTSDVEISWSEA